MSLAITPTNAINRLNLDALVILSDSASTYISVALYQDSTVNALAATNGFQSAANRPNTLSFAHEMAAGTVSSTTFKIFAGGDAGGTTTFNGDGGARRFGGVAASHFRISEVCV